MKEKINMKKFYIAFLMLLTFASCSSNMEAKAKHQAEAGNRINSSQQNTDSLFKEMDNSKDNSN